VKSVRTATRLAAKEDTLVTLLERREATEVAALLSAMNLARGELEAFIAGTASERMVGPRKNGWSIKDHLYHIATWDSYLIALLERQPRLPAVGIDSDPAGEYDGVNAIFFERGKDLPLSHVLGLFRSNRGRIIEQVQKLNDTDLERAAADFQPPEPKRLTGRLGEWILTITANHDRVHHGWMKELLAER
jgi:hypothetical protein